MNFVVEEQYLTHLIRIDPLVIIYAVLLHTSRERLIITEEL
jgi:hypothetical protein